MARSPSAPSIRDRLVRDWYLPHRTLLATVLAPLGLLFRGIVAARRAGYRIGLIETTTLPVPVIVVGNIAVGGTGKTPLVLWLVNALMARGRRPGIVSRGYGGDNAVPREIASDGDPRMTGDEPLLLAATGRPVWIGRDRVAAARSLLAAHPDIDIIISDDGLQHYALSRAFEIVVIDGARGFGNGAVIPAGPLREPVSRIHDVDAIVINGPLPAPGFLARSAAPRFAMTLDGDQFVNLNEPERRATADMFRGKRVHAVAGIGNPDRFFETLRRLGLEPICHPFPDHHRYEPADLAMRDADVIVMTEKDAIKCGHFADARMWSLPVIASVATGLIERVLEKIDGSEAA